MDTDAPRLILDLTRLVARAGDDVLTGIDRVERAYLRATLARDPGALFLVGTRAGQLILPGKAGLRVLDWIERPAAAPAPLRLLRRLAGRRAARSAALAMLWPMVLGRARNGAGLACALGARMGPSGGWFLSVGHQNPAGLAAMAEVPGLRRAVLIHDTIPLDPPVQPRAASRLRPVLAEAARAELAICNSTATAADLARHAGPPARPLIAPLGIDLAAPGHEALPAGLDGGDGRAMFLALGTIEPRKRQDFLLDLWQALAADPPERGMPRLVLAGRIGGAGASVAARARSLAARGLPVTLASGLPDAGVAALMGRAVALLAPGRAEGFGLPVAEAAARGLPVLAAPLPVYREIVGDYPAYLPAEAAGSWLAAIRALAARPRPAAAPPRRGIDVPAWEDHFARVFGAMAEGPVP
ncbi:MAG: glycosyltransferase [Rhodobacteraceae bacterium]|nr:glycosyltransferase [Paracoccaceae bacterium]